MLGMGGWRKKIHDCEGRTRCGRRGCHAWATAASESAFRRPAGHGGPRRQWLHPRLRCVGLATSRGRCGYERRVGWASVGYYRLCRAPTTSRTRRAWADKAEVNEGKIGLRKRGRSLSQRLITANAPYLFHFGIDSVRPRPSAESDPPRRRES
jgi:hypothetical protein